jgi:pilus assembly protein Flp/PilA
MLARSLARRLRAASSSRESKEAGVIETLRRFLADETGATAIEYGLIAAGVALAIITVINGLGSKLNAKFGSISAALR